VSEAIELLKGSAHVAGRRNSYWLIAKRRSGRLEVLTTFLSNGRAVLPVFSFEEEANLYLRHGIPGSWQLRRTQTGELVSLLYGLCSKVELVALDPVSDVEIDVVNRLVSLERERFVDVLLRKEASLRSSLRTAQAISAPDDHRGASAQTVGAVSWNSGGEG
jgi:hypothetical protein